MMKSGFIQVWKNNWGLRPFRQQFLWSGAGLFVGLFVEGLFLEQIHPRSGVVLPDPLLALFSPVDLHWVTHALIYGGLLLGMFSLVFRPFALLLVIRASLIIIFFRVIFPFVLPLDPPHGIIPLVDPFIEMSFVKPTPTHDLFFAWQPAVMILFALQAEGKDLKMIFGAVAVLISAFLLAQHAQYTISIVTAPCFTIAAYGIAEWNTVGFAADSRPGRNGTVKADKLNGSVLRADTRTVRSGSSAC